MHCGEIGMSSRPLVHIKNLLPPSLVSAASHEECTDTSTFDVLDGSPSLRASSYNIYIDLPNTGDEMLLVHGYTGAFDRVSRAVGQYIRSLEPRSAPKPLYGSWTDRTSSDSVAAPPSNSTLAILRRRGYLTPLSSSQEERIFIKLVETIHRQSLSGAPNYILMPTYNCNLRCAYCFQDHMRTDSDFSHLLKPMSLEMVNSILQAMEHLEEERNFTPTNEARRSIGFFGGEPLLESNYALLKYIVEKASERPSEFWAVSNATELYAYKDLLGPGQIERIQVTLDGPPEWHDKRRIRPDGSGSFMQIADNITMALDLGVNISVRMNIDRTNINSIPPLVEAFHGYGWDKYPHFSSYASPVHAANDNVEKMSTMDSAELAEQLIALAQIYPTTSIVGRPDLGMKTRARHVFDGQASGGYAYRESFCGAQTSMFIFDPFGDVYACWEKTGEASIRIGRIESGAVVLNAPMNDLWRTRTIASNPVCRQCRYSFHCGGGCAVLAYDRSGNYHSNFCDGFAKRLRSNIADAYLEHLSGVVPALTQGPICDM